MKRYILLLFGFWAVLSNVQAQDLHNPKRFGFTATIKVPRTAKEILMDSTLSWIRGTLVNPRFNLRQVNEDEHYITGGASHTDDSGTTVFDLTFYFKNNMVDMVADNAIYSTVGRLPRRERTKGSAKRKTKEYLYQLSYSLEEYLKGPQPNASR